MTVSAVFPANTVLRISSTYEFELYTPVKELDKVDLIFLDPEYPHLMEVADYVPDTYHFVDLEVSAEAEIIDLQTYEVKLFDPIAFARSRRIALPDDVSKSMIVTFVIRKTTNGSSNNVVDSLFKMIKDGAAAAQKAKPRGENIYKYFPV